MNRSSIGPVLRAHVVSLVREYGWGAHDKIFSAWPGGPKWSVKWQRIYAATKYNGNAEEVDQILSM